MTEKSIQQQLDEQRAMSKLHKMTERSINHSIANIENWNNPDYRKKMEKTQSSDAYKTKISKTTKDRWGDEYYQSRLSNSHKEAWENDPERKKAVIEQFKQPKTESHKKNIAEATKRFNQTPEGKKVLQAKADKQRGKPRRIEKCPHCGKEGGEGIMKRWHFDNCKQK